MKINHVSTTVKHIEKYIAELSKKNLYANRLNNKKGFTLIELIAVLAVISILAIIAIMRMGGLTAIAQERTDRINARTLTSIATSYNALPENNNDWPWNDGDKFISVPSDHVEIGAYISKTVSIVKSGNQFLFADGRVTVIANDESGENNDGSTGNEGDTGNNGTAPATVGDILNYLNNSPTSANGYTIDLVTELGDGSIVSWDNLVVVGGNNANPAAEYEGDNNGKLRLLFPSQGNKQYTSEITAVIVVNGEEVNVKYTITTNSTPNQGGPGVSISFEIISD